MVLYRMKIYGSAFLLTLFAAASMETIKFDISSGAGFGSHTVNCSTNYKLLSCGFGNNSPMLSSRGNASYRYAVPAGANGCQCFGPLGGNCYALCASNVVNFIIRSVGGPRNGEFTTSCPLGRKVVGCSAVPSGEGMEISRSNYPSENGDYCTCYDGYRAWCVATCVSNVANYRVEKVYGKGNFQVYCSNGRSVLGCGIQPLDLLGGLSGLHLQRAMTFVPNIGCSCYDALGANCYAICGDLF